MNEKTDLSALMIDWSTQSDEEIAFALEQSARSFSEDLAVSAPAETSLRALLVQQTLALDPEGLNNPDNVAVVDLVTKVMVELSQEAAKRIRKRWPHADYVD
jgi:hypothetical protein